MLDPLLSSPSLKRLASLLQSEEALLFEQLWDAPKALLALLALKKLGRPVLILSGEEREEHLLEALLFFDPRCAELFPAWESLPGEGIPPNPDVVGRRFQLLSQLDKGEAPGIILTPLQGALQRVCTRKMLQSKRLEIKKGEELPFNLLPELLLDLGYRREGVAADKGEFAVRGGIVDIFPLSAFDPYRLDFFGDVVEEIRLYNPASQKSIGGAEELFIPPADEPALLKEESATLIDYLPKETLIIFDELLALEDRYVALKSLTEGCTSLFLSFRELFEVLTSFRRCYLTKEPLETLGEMKRKEGTKVTLEMIDQRIEAKRASHPFLPLEEQFQWEEGASEGERLAAAAAQTKQLPLTLVSASDAEERRAKEQLPSESAITFVQGKLSSGFALMDPPYALLPYAALTHKQQVVRHKWRNTYHTPSSEFHTLEKGDLVVHFHNGVGQFLGIEKQPNHLGEEEEFLLIAYANQSRLYVPLSQSHLISRYIGTKEELPPLNVLGTKKWQQAKRKAQQAIIGYAKDLIEMQAQRETQGGFCFPPDSDDLTLFEEEFPFVETQDQLDAIGAIKRDMESEKGMDRLICGDVGYGKTEVAMRAAFKAAFDGKKQVAVLVPTTILAMQHYENFKARMANFPLTIGVASRFISSKEMKGYLEGTARGSVDILIGTHRLISKDVEFKDLGLIIIDEEQRFGVRAKEHLKKLKVGVDCLTLSATPIPRTLYSSLIGVREMSVINTPPQDRLPTRTILAEREQELIKNGFLREMARDGQGYFIHNRIETIYKVAKELEELLPTAKIGVAHGQMSSESVDAVFHQFKQGELHILVATTIVENGVDIPNANTIFIDRSDTFGMADLYQLRGRVGRGSRAAYAYFLTPKNRELPEISRKRLQALVEASGFGGGMKLAMRDLEIRGAGDILGTQQAGNVSAIGFHFYCKLLKQAIDTLKKEATPSFFETKLEFSFNAQLPPTYIAETHLRMELYHRLGEAATNEEIDALFDELRDRFGPPPPPAKWLYHLNRIRLFGMRHHFTLLKFEKILLHAKRQTKKQLIEKRICLPPLIKDPEQLELLTFGFLKRDFHL